MYNGIAYLIAEKTWTKDDVGNEIPNQTKSEIFVKEGSIFSTEFFAASQQGLKAEKKLITQIIDYDGQSLIEYGNKTYSIYRTFQKNDEIELYLTYKIGN